MTISSNTKLYCLIGHPVSKSLSPYIHNSSFKANGIDARYLTFDVEEERLGDAVKGIKALGIEGFNVTIPHKINIIKYLDEVDDDAKLLGAVNTVKNVDGKLIGYNTDGEGFLKSLYENGVDPVNKNVLIIGAGGAARAIALKLAQIGVSKIIILNRTKDRAKSLAQYISDKFPEVFIDTYSLDESFLHRDNRIINDMDLVINCTSIGMYPEDNEEPIDPLIFNSSATIVDIVYKPLLTNFLQKAKKNGNNVIGGIHMLVNQAILSEEIWLNCKISLKIVEGIKKDLEI